MNSEDIKNKMGAVLLVIGVVLTLNIVLKLFEVSFIPVQLIYVLASVLKAPVILFVSELGDFDLEAFIAMLMYLALYFIGLKLVDRLAGDEDQDIPQNSPQTI